MDRADVFPVRAVGSLQKWDEESRVESAREAAIVDEAKWRSVCAAVNVRDEYQCRACGRRCNPQALSMLLKGHHHHIVYRSAGGPDETWNVCLLCSDCHDSVHVRRTLAIEGNADEAPWLTLQARDRETGQWFVWKQETGIRLYERD